jgi:hypothetical protein
MEREFDAELCEELVRMAEQGRAIRAALSSEDSQYEYRGFHWGAGPHVSHALL